MNWKKRFSGFLSFMTFTIYRKDDVLAAKVLAAHKHFICSQQENFYQETL